jgi:acetoin utilization protein AcuB
MYVGLKMSTNLVTVTPETLLIDANNLMEENGLWLLPVVEDEKLIGYLQKEDVRSGLPSRATLLSRHELTTIISKVTVADFIRKDIVTVFPETEIEVAAELMVDHELPGLAVVDKSDRLVGYMSRKIMLEILVEAMGLHRSGKRFAIEFKDRLESWPKWPHL